MNIRTTVSAKGQVVIPKDVRDQLGLKPGQQLEVTMTAAGGVLLSPIHVRSGRTTEEILRHLREIAPPYRGPPVSIEDMNSSRCDVPRGLGAMTRALDTNVLARALADHDSPQHPAAVATLAEPFAVSLSVLMEVEWVLRSVYRWPRSRITAAFRDLLDIPTLHAPPAGAVWIVDRFAAGADFADMVHLSTAAGADRFATFDTGIVKFDPPLPIETLA